MQPAVQTDNPAPRPRFAPAIATAALLALAAALLVLHVRVFSIHGSPPDAAALVRGALRTPATFVTDDAYISFVYARNLAEHGQIVFNLGENPVEGYTNFLWTVLLAGLMKVGIVPERSSVPLGIGFAIGTMLVCAWLMRRLRAGDWSPWDAVPALFLAAVPGYACWSSGGLETQMFTFLATTGMALYLAPRPGVPSHEEPLRATAAIAFGLAALCRPEGILFFALTLAHRALRNVYFLRRFRPTRDEWIYVALFAAFVVPHFLWRHAYYGYWLPNTFYIKSSGGAGTWGRGFYYLRRYFEAYALLAFVLVPLASLYRKRESSTNRLFGFAALVAPAFWLYVASVGGDFMGLFRFALPVVPLVVVAAALGLRALIAPVAPRMPWLAPAVVVALLGAYLGHATVVDRKALIATGPEASDRGIDTPGYLKYYTDDRAAIGRWFARYAQPDDYAAVGGAGAQVYFSRIKSLDCFGLSDEHIAHDVPAVDSRPGHQKYAPVDYQLSKKPTIITSNYYTIGHAPAPRSDEPFWRQHGYHYVSVQIPGLSAPWYTFLKRMDRRIGPLAPVDAELN